MGQDKGSETLAQILIHRPERIAAAWRQMRCAARFQGSYEAASALDGAIESFLREIGATLAGASGSPWARARGVLRWVHPEGERLLKEEFQALRVCLKEAAAAVAASAEAWEKVSGCLNQAWVSALSAVRKMENPDAPEPALRFGGILVETFSSAPSARHESASSSAAPLN